MINFHYFNCKNIPVVKNCNRVQSFYTMDTFNDPSCTTAHSISTTLDSKEDKSQSPNCLHETGCSLSPSHDQILHLASQLKRNCNDQGIENNPKMSAQTIYQMGLEHFKSSPDKISLIKCVGLLNSAIARNPSNVSDIKQDLYQKCQHILQLANAKDNTADLLAQAKHIKSQINEMRRTTKNNLDTMNNFKHSDKVSTADLTNQQTLKINSIKQIQHQVTARYKQIMKTISKYCHDVMGPQPCKFAIVGMGSLARNEITPYSDFEHIILLENRESYEHHLKYFRWFSVIFHIIILNLQETIIPSLNVKHLNDKTAESGDWFFDTQTKGVSFDGMMPHACKFPLGKAETIKTSTTELIKPVNKMLEYLSCKDSFVNDYHLSDILMQTCFVYGDNNLHQVFENGISLHINAKSKQEKFADIKFQLQNDLHAFANIINIRKIKRKGTFNVKELFYRTSTLFITAFGRIFDIKSSSCFDIINALGKKKQISDYAKQKLSFAVAIACEIRLSVYINAKSQHDYVQTCENGETVFDEIFKIVDRQSIVSYFQITTSLHAEVMILLKGKLKTFQMDESLCNIYIMYMLGMDEMALSLFSKYDLWNQVLFRIKYSHNKIHSVFDKRLSKLENETNFNITLPPQEQLEELFHNICDIVQVLVFSQGNKYDRWQILDCLLDVCKRLTIKGHKLVKSGETDENAFLIGYLSMLVASLLTESNELDKASDYMNQSFDLQSNNPKYTFLFYLLAGNNWFKMEQYEKSLHCLQIALGIRLSARFDFCNHFNNYLIAMMYSGIGACLLKLDQYADSLVYLNIAVHLAVKYSLEKHHFSIFAFNPTSVSLDLDVCLKKLQAFNN